MFPNRTEKTALAERLGVPPEKVMVCLSQMFYSDIFAPEKDRRKFDRLRTSNSKYVVEKKTHSI